MDEEEEEKDVGADDDEADDDDAETDDDDDDDDYEEEDDEDVYSEEDGDIEKKKKRTASSVWGTTGGVSVDHGEFVFNLIDFYYDLFLIIALRVLTYVFLHSGCRGTCKESGGDGWARLYGSE